MPQVVLPGERLDVNGERSVVNACRSIAVLSSHEVLIDTLRKKRNNWCNDSIKPNEYSVQSGIRCPLVLRPTLAVEAPPGAAHIPRAEHVDETPTFNAKP